jgi:hypothetical protein
VAAACSRELLLGSDQQTGSSARAGSAGAAAAAGGLGGTTGAAGAAGEASCERSACYGKVYLCGNCKDDDGDGLIDAEDPECTGPCDDREDSLAVGLPGEAATTCSEDCYFDRGNGAGHGDCTFSHHCDAKAVAPDYPPTGDSSCAYDENAKIPGTNATCSDLRGTQPAGCLETCGPLVPNGCDCFGCCELPPGSGTTVWLETQLPCTQVASCVNRCEDCEVCVGRTAPAPSCSDGGAMRCAAGYQPCGTTSDESCPMRSYCVTGCCIPEPH